MSPTTATPQILLAHHLKQLRLPTILREYDRSPRPVPARVSITHVICCAWSSWSCWNGSSGRSSGGSGRLGSRS
jgi:hypothetical protein